jgi:hypothetical protein
VKKAVMKGKKLLLMGSSAFSAEELPTEVKEKIDEAIASNMVIIVGEAPGANRLYQDYLRSRGYRNVIVGHAVRLRYNAGNWKDVQYGKDLRERERRMIEDCDSAVIIWANNSGVIAENLELLKRLDKPTFLYEYSTKTKVAATGWLDPKRIYDPYYYMKEHYRKQKARL